MPQFDLAFYPAQIFWLFVSFGFLYLMMRHLICPKIETVLSEREKALDDLLTKAEALNKKATDLHQKYQAFLSETEQMKAEKIQNAYKEIQHQMKALENKNDSMLKQRIRRAEQKIEKTTEQLKRKSDKLSLDLAEQLAEQIRKEGELLP